MAEPILETKNLRFSYEEGPEIIKGISLQVNPGDFVAVIGQNGSGKTTLVKHFNGLHKPSSGEVLFNGENIAGKQVGALAKKIGYVFQNPDHQIFNPTVREEIAFGPRNLGLDEAEIEERTENAIARFGLEEYADREPAVIGFGIRRKVSVAAVYSMDTPILILDEPTTGLDFRSTTDLMDLICELNDNGKTIVFITHDMRVVAKYIPKCLVIRDGEVIADDKTRAIYHQYEMLQKTKIRLPQITNLSRQMKESGIDMPDDILSVSEFADTYDRVVLKRG
jgi:energy-coupling factor transport system ATP-binding protein